MEHKNKLSRWENEKYFRVIWTTKDWRNGLAERSWLGAAEITKDKRNKEIDSGDETPNRGVGIIVKRMIAKNLYGPRPYLAES